MPSRASPCALEGTTLVPCRAEGGDLQGTTNTKITTENTNLDYINLINQKNDTSDENPTYQVYRMDEIKAYREIIKVNLDYDVMRSRLIFDSEKIKKEAEDKEGK